MNGREARHERNTSVKRLSTAGKGVYASVNRFEDNRHCFVCGEHNESGLNLDWWFNEDESHLLTEFVPDERYQGWRGVVHGGIVTAVLDEIMVNYIILKGVGVVSARLNVRFREPARVGESMRFSGTAERMRGRLYEGTSRCTQNGNVVATATAKLMEVEAEVPTIWDDD